MPRPPPRARPASPPARDAAGPASASAVAAAIVPRSVRKSFAVKSPPVAVPHVVVDLRAAERPEAIVVLPGQVARTRRCARSSSAETAASAASVTSALHLLAALRREREPHDLAVELHVAHQEGRQAEAAVRLEVRLGSHPHGHEVEQAERGGEDAIAGESLDARGPA